MLLAVPFVAPLLDARRAPGRPPIARWLVPVAVFAGSLAVLILPCYLATGRFFPSALGTRVAVAPLSSPEAFWRAIVSAFSLKAYWSSEWLVYTCLSLGVALALSIARRSHALVGLALTLLLFFVARALFGLTHFNVEDRYISYLWPLFALVFAVGAGALWPAAASLATRAPRAFGMSPGPETGRRASLLAAAILISVAAAFPVRNFMARFDHHVRLMDAIVVQPSLWMRENLPPGSRICMEPAGAIRVFTDFYLVDVIGLTTTHRHTHRGDYASFLRANRVDYVFDRPPRTTVLVQRGLGREIHAWAKDVKPWGDIRLYELR